MSLNWTSLKANTASFDILYFIYFAIGNPTCHVTVRYLHVNNTIVHLHVLRDSDCASQHANVEQVTKRRKRHPQSGGEETGLSSSQFPLHKACDFCESDALFIHKFCRFLRVPKEGEFSMYNFVSSAARHLYVIFCRKNGSECSFSESYIQDISCWRFEVVLFLLSNLFSKWKCCSYALRHFLFTHSDYIILKNLIDETKWNEDFPWQYLENDHNHNNDNNTQLKTRGHRYFSQCFFFSSLKISNKRLTFRGKIGLKIFEFFLRKKIISSNY